MVQRVLLALCISLVVSSGIMLILGRSTKTHITKLPELTYMSASKDIEVGQVLGDGDLLEVSWPQSHALDGGLTKRVEVVNRTALVSLKKGQPVLSQYLSAPGAGSGLAARIPDGMRAIALRSDEIVGVGGFLHPGSHVDVLVTCRLGSDSELSTLTALQNAEVIATGQRSQPDPSGKPESVTVVTLLLTPENAERAVLAASQGSVHLVLRNNTDAQASTTSPMKLSLLAGVARPSVTPAAARTPAPSHLPLRSAEPSIETVLDGAPQSASLETRGTR